MQERAMNVFSAAEISPPLDLVGSRIVIVFTDTEKSTRLAQRLGDEWAEALSGHHRVIQSRLRQRGGFEASNQGDGFNYLFRDVRAAVTAVVDACQALLDTPADQPQFRDRFAVHIGEVGFVASVGFMGLDFHRAARIADAANGNQILLSETALLELGDALPPGLQLADHGYFWLKDIRRPERIIELVLPTAEPRGLRARSVGSIDLPPTPSRLVGRDELLAELLSLVEEARPGAVISLVGFGGVGKTRLAIELLRTVEGRPGHFVDLSQTEDVSQLARALTNSLGLDPAVPPTLGVAAQELEARRAVVVLDNFEQLVAAAPDVATMARHAPNVVVVVTSRLELRIAEEIVVEVPPLRTEPTTSAPSAAVELFQHLTDSRGERSDRGEHDAEAIAAICTALDGIPLALELAVGRLATLGLTELASQVERSIAVLAGGRRDSPERHRALISSVLWNYGMLSAEAQHLFKAMSLLPAGGTTQTLAAASELDETAVVDAIAELDDNRLITVQDDGSGRRRFSMLRVIREVARTELERNDESPARQASTVHVVTALVRGSAAALNGPDQAVAYRALHDDLDNLRAILGWAADDPGLLDLALAASADLTTFWWQSGHLIEGLEWLRRLCNASGARGCRNYARALVQTSILAMYGGEADEAISAGETAVARCRTEGRTGGTLSAGLHVLAAAYSARGLRELALDTIAEATRIDRGLPDPIRAFHLVSAGNVLLAEDGVSLAERNYRESLEIFTALGESWMRAAPISRLAEVALRRGELAEALELAHEGLDRWRESPGVGGRARAQAGLARAKWCAGDLGEAEALANDAFDWACEVNALGELPWAFAVLGAVGASHERFEQAAELFGLAYGFAQSFGQPVHGCLHHELAPAVASVDHALGADQAASLVDIGRRRSVADVVRTGRAAWH